MRLIRPDPRTSDVVMLNIGANKGHEIAEFVQRRWSDVLCAHQQGDIAVLSELSASAFARRGERGGQRARLQNNTRWGAETSAPRY